MTTIIGIDPGLVHTGCVAMQFTAAGKLIVSSEAFAGGDADGPAVWASAFGGQVFIESYRPRGKVYGTDTQMRELLSKFRVALPQATVLDNTGVKQVIRQPLMELFGVWSFAQKTHHQDLRSAARIALYGAVKDEALNRVLYEYAINNV